MIESLAQLVRHFLGLSLPAKGTVIYKVLVFAEVEVRVEHYLNVAREILVSHLVMIKEIFAVDPQSLRSCIELFGGSWSSLPDNSEFLSSEEGDLVLVGMGSSLFLGFPEHAGNTE